MITILGAAFIALSLYSSVDMYDNLEHYGFLDMIFQIVLIIMSGAVGLVFLCWEIT
jgi:hypothetical protein